MNTSNPTLRPFANVVNVGATGVTYESRDTMTVDGTIHKTGILAMLLALSFAFTWSALTKEVRPDIGAFIFGGMIAGFVTALIISFSPKTAPYLSPVYALAEGFVIAAISFLLEQKYHGIALQAGALTITTVFGMMVAYRTGIVKVNDTFRTVIIGATLTVMLYGLAGLIAMFFGVMLPGISWQDGSWFSILISGVFVVIAAMNLALDFDMIAQGAGAAPKYMEWYGAFSLMVTVIWLYIEILRLLSKFRSR